MKHWACLALCAWILSAQADDVAPTIADFSQGLGLSVPSTTIDKTYLPFYFNTLSLNPSYANNENITNNATASTGGFNLIIQNNSNTQLYVYLASFAQGAGLPGVTYCSVSANGMANYQNCAGGYRAFER